MLPIETGWGPHPHIVPEHPEEVAFWARHLGVDRDTLLAAIEEAGTRLDRIKRDLSFRCPGWSPPERSY
jgi:hypothetical protein